MKDHDEIYGRREIFVIAGCTRERINEGLVEVLNVAEDIQGRDVLTFKCPLCGATHDSLRLG